jgi:hypothetical protein
MRSKWDVQFRIDLGPVTRTKWDRNEIVWKTVGMVTYKPATNCLLPDRVDHYCPNCESVPLSYNTGFTLLLWGWGRISCYYERYTPEMFND